MPTLRVVVDDGAAQGHRGGVRQEYGLSHVTIEVEQDEPGGREEGGRCLGKRSGRLSTTAAGPRYGADVQAGA